MENSTLNNRYTIIEKIGSGGMGTVYKANDTRLDRIVAIKVLKDNLTDNSEFIRRFENEAKSIARLKHPNIVTVYDINNIDGIYYIVMEYIPGTSLKNLILEKGFLDYHNTKNIFFNILNAIEHAHKNNIIHRDIKPHNILISEDNIPKVLDFGIAKLLTDTELTKAGNILGSLTYASPEQSQGLIIDKRSDIYSLGITFYETLNGKPPFSGEDISSIIFKHIQEIPKPLHEISNLVPFEISKIISKMLEKSSDDRYQNIEEITTDLKSFDNNTNNFNIAQTISDVHFSELARLNHLQDSHIQNNSNTNSTSITTNTDTNTVESSSKKFLNKLLISMMVIIAFLAIIIVVLINNSNNNQSNQDLAMNINSDSSNSNSNNSNSNSTSRGKISDDKSDSKVSDSDNSEYIFPNSQNELLTNNDLVGKDEKLLELGRNEIFARHGYIFQTGEISNYFNSKSWYIPENPADSFDFNSLSTIEKENINFIKNIEKQY